MTLKIKEFKTIKSPYIEVNTIDELKSTINYIKALNNNNEIFILENEQKEPIYDAIQLYIKYFDNFDEAFKQALRHEAQFIIHFKEA